MEPSYVFCEQLTDGRLSFLGMNPRIEKLMEVKENEKRGKLEKKRETDVSDEQLTVQWHRIRGQFDVPQRQPKKSQYRKTKGEEGEPMEKKQKFLKPVD